MASSINDGAGRSAAFDRIAAIYGDTGTQTQQPDPKTAFDAIARRTKVPANVLMALDEAQGGGLSVERAEANAARLAAALAEQQPLERAVGALAGDPGQGGAVMNRAYDIADSLYPAAPPPPDRGTDGRVSAAEGIGGAARATLAGAVSGIGGALEAGGVALDEALRVGADPKLNKPTPVRGIARGLGDLVRGGGDKLTGLSTDDYQGAVAGTEPGGNLLDPSSWTLGDDPSILGLINVAGQGLGSMLPIVAMPTAGAGAVFGGLMGAGEGVENGRKFVEDAAATLGPDGKPEIAALPEYQKRIAEGRTHEDAVADLVRQAENNAGFRQGLVASVGGAATQRIMSKADGWLGQGGRLTRAVKKAGTSAVEEGVQEAAEGAASQTGIMAATGADLDPLADSFGNFVGGALAGGGIGGIAGALGPGEGGPAPIPPADPASGPLPPSRGLPSPTNGGTIFSGPPPAEPATALEPAPTPPVAGPSVADAPLDPVAPAPAPELAPVQGQGRGLPSIVTGEPPAPAPLPSTRIPPNEPLIPTPPASSPVGAGAVAAPPVPGAAAPMPLTPSRIPPNQPLTAPPAGSIAPLGEPVAAPIPGAAAAGPAPIQDPTIDPVTDPNADLSDMFDDLMEQEAPTPGGPMEGISQGLVGAIPEPVAPPPLRFPDQKPGSTIKLGLPDGVNLNGVFIREEGDNVVMRINGEERNVPAAEFDAARDQAEANELAAKAAADAAKAAAKGAPKGQPAPAPIPEPAAMPGPQPVETGANSGASAAPLETAATPAPTPSKLDTALAAAMEAGEGQYTTAKGKAKSGFILKGITKAEANEIDQYAIKLPGNGGFMVNPQRAEAWMLDRRAAGTPAPQSPSATINQDGDNAGISVTPGTDPSNEANNPPQSPQGAALSEANVPVANPYEAAGMTKGGTPGTFHIAKGGAAWSIRERPNGQVMAFSVDEAGRDKLLGPFGDAATALAVLRAEGAPLKTSVAEAAEGTNPTPTPAQAEAENYQTGKTTWNGLRLSVENKKESQRTGTDPSGREWSVTMPAHYGRILRTKGADGDHVDFYMGDNELSDNVYVIDQMDPETGTFDEHKVMLGFDSPLQARGTYAAAFSDGKGSERIGALTYMTVDAFKESLASARWDGPMSADLAARLSAQPAQTGAETDVSTPNGQKPAPTPGKQGVTSQNLQAVEGLRTIDGPYRLAENLTPANKKAMGAARGSDLGELLGEMDAAARRAAAQHKRNPGLQTETLMQEAEALADALLDANRATKGNLTWPGRDEDTGEYDYDGGPVSDALEWLDNFEGMGVNTDTTDPNVAGAYESNPDRPRKPEDEIFPATKGTVNLSAKGKQSGNLPLDEAQARVQGWKDTAKAIGKTGANAKKVVISLFDYTGAWSQPWEDAGYQVIRHDIKTGSDIITDAWITENIQELRDSGLEVYGILSACPCTTFAGSGSRWWQDRHDVESPDALAQVFGERALSSGAKSALEYNLMLLDATRDVVREANPTGFHVLENPVGRIQEKGKLPDPGARFDPFNFGDPYTKRTALFGDFQADLPLANVDPVEGSKMQNKLRGNDPMGKEERSTTPEGFAYAFFMANDPAARAVKDGNALTDQETAAPESPANAGDPAPETAPDQETVKKPATGLDDGYPTQNDTEAGGPSWALRRWAETATDAELEARATDYGFAGPYVQQVLDARRAAQPAEGEGKKSTPPATPAAKPAESAGPRKPKLQDFGEKIGGSRKDQAATYRSNLDTDAVEGMTVTEALPEPNYAKLREDGVSPAALAAISLARAAVKRKPVKYWQVRGWARTVTEARTTIADLIAGDMHAADAIKPLALDQSYLSEADISDLLTGMADLPLADMGIAGREALDGVHWSTAKLMREGGPTAWRDWIAHRVKRARDRQAEARDKPFDFGLHTRYNQSSGAGFVYARKPKLIKLATYPSIEEAGEALNDPEARADLEEKAREMKRGFQERPDSPNRDRKGPARRKGDMTPELFQKTFGLKGGEFGQYVTAKERQTFLNDTADALFDLAGLLGLPPSALSLNGTLGIGFGSRGQGNRGGMVAAAHYEPGYKAINLTRGAGAGTLAHEWFHAFDDYMGGLMHAGGLLTAKKHSQLLYMSERNTDPDQAQVLRALYQTISKAHQTGWHRKNLELDQFKSKPYWSSPEEELARIFEVMVVEGLEDRSSRNNFLSHIERNSGAYPTGREMAAGVRPAMEGLFDAMGRLLKGEGKVPAMGDLLPTARSRPLEVGMQWDSPGGRVTITAEGKGGRDNDKRTFTIRTGGDASTDQTIRDDEAARLRALHLWQTSDEGRFQMIREEEEAAAKRAEVAARDEAMATMQKALDGFAEDEGMSEGSAAHASRVMAEPIKGSGQIRGRAIMDAVAKGATFVEGTKTLRWPVAEGMHRILSEETMRATGVSFARYLISQRDGTTLSDADAYKLFGNRGPAGGALDLTQGPADPAAAPPADPNADLSDMFDDLLEQEAPTAPEGEAPATETPADPDAPVNPAPEPDPAPGADGDLPVRERIARAFVNALYTGRPVTNIREARALVAEKVGEGIADKDIEEGIEAGLVRRAQTIAQDRASTPAQKYASLVALYRSQPLLTTRTSTSVEQQAYSTPAPLAYVASRLARINEDSTVYEPTAGNGMLLIEASQDLVTANELNPDRFATLQNVTARDATLSNMDAMEHQPGGPFDVVITNPPFGKIKNDAGRDRRWKLGGTTTPLIDHAIVWKSLAAMKPEGRAVLIIGGMQGTPDERRAGYQTRDNSKFFTKLYDEYNVVDHWTADGRLYQRQGAGWPVDIIVIDGRGDSELSYPYVTPPRLLDGWDQIGTEFIGEQSDSDAGARSGSGDAAGNGTRRDQTGDGPQGDGPTDRPDGEGNGPRQPADGEQSGDGNGGAGPDGTQTGGRDGGRKRSPAKRAGGGVSPDGGSSQQRPGSRGPAGTDQSGRVPGGTVSGVTPPRTAGEAASSAASNVGDSFADIAKGLAALYGHNPNKLNMGFVPDEQQYQRAKGFFLSAVRKLYKAGQDITDVMRAVIRELLGAGMPRETVVAMKNDIVRFTGEVRDGTIPEAELLPPEAAPKAKRENTEVETDYQVQYTPHSEARFAVGTLVPRAMQGAVDKALSNLEDRVGSIDAYVAEKLDYPVERVTGSDGKPGYFSAEQVDALALAIDNIEKGAAFIIGDQTGVGKGRVVAGIIRYAMKAGKVPVFVTKQPGLYGDMVRDLRDIGEAGMEGKILPTNKLRGKDAVPLSNDPGDLMTSPPEAKQKALLRQIGESGVMPEGYSAIFTTYPQLQYAAGGSGVKTERQRALDAIADHVVLIMDESHEAGGTATRQIDPETGEEKPTRADYFREVLLKTAGAMFSSATYAKNPTVMTLYAQTDMRYAFDDIKTLPETVERGGVPLQQVIANMLVEAGQYMRRERSYEGVNVGMPTVDVDPAMAEATATMTAALFNLDRDYMEDLRSAFQEAKLKEGLQGANDTGVGESAVESAGFASTMHNLVNQLLFAMKVDSVADMAIALHERGQKPLISITNTNESILSEYVDQEGISRGQPIDFTMRALIERYLKRLRRITLKDSDDNREFVYMTDADVLEHGGPDALDAIRAVEAMLETSPIATLPGMPMDYLIDKMEAAGMKVGEITGRSLTTKGGRLRSRESGDAAKKREMNAFNSGKMDAVVLNRSGSTGFSMHATGLKGNDGKQRHMIVLQPDPNIDVFMQMLGRIHRTGQIVLPEYSIPVSSLAIEKRVAANLMKKLASLNANTTAGKDSAISLDNVVDFLNRYGDQVMKDILREDSYLSARLGIIGLGGQDGRPPEGLASKVTGRMAVLLPQEVNDLYERIEAGYTALIEALDRMGMNTLEAKTLDLQAQPVSTTELVAPREDGGDSPFAAAANIEVLRVRRLGRPYNKAELTAEILKRMDGTNPSQHTAPLLAKLKADLDPYLDTMRERVEAERAKMPEAKTQKQKDRIEATITNWNQKIDSAQATMRAMSQKIAELAPGNGFHLRMTEDSQVVMFPAVVMELDWKALKGNPTAASTIRIRFAIADAAREIWVPLSKLMDSESAFDVTRADFKNVMAAFEAGQTESRETRQIITGNLLSGYASFQRGQIIMFTREDGSTTQGILMPRSFDLRAELEARAVEFKDAEQVMQFVEEGGGSRLVDTDDGVAQVKMDSRGAYLFEVKKKGGKPYYLNRGVRGALGDFVAGRGPGAGGKFVAQTANRSDALAAIEAWTDQVGATLVANSFKDEARAITGEVLPDATGGEVQESRFGSDGRLTPAQARQINAAARAELRNVGLLGRVRAEAGTGGTAAGTYSRGVIRILRHRNGAWRHTLDHEILHALRDPAMWGGEAGLFTRAEWSALARAARADEGIRARVERAYADKTTREQTEEMVAELYADWATNQRATPKGPLREGLSRIRSFFRAMASALRGQGFVDAAQIMRDIASGKIAGREPDGNGHGPNGSGNGNGPRRGNAQNRENAQNGQTRESRNMDPIRAAMSSGRARAAGMVSRENWKKAPQVFDGWLTDAMGRSAKFNILGLVPGHPLFAELGKNLSAAQTYLFNKQAMDAERNKWQARSAEAVDRWSALARKDSEANDRLMSLMHDSTIAGIDPSKADEWKHTHAHELDRIDATPNPSEKQRAFAERIRRETRDHGETYSKLRAEYDALPPAFRALYGDIREEYGAMADATDDALIESIQIASDIAAKRARIEHEREMSRIEDEGLTGRARAREINAANDRLAAAEGRAINGGRAKAIAMRAAFETNRMSGPYFPLSRYGNYFVTVKDENGKVISFSRFETQAQQAREVAERTAEGQAEGWTVSHGALTDSAELRGAVDPVFITEIETILEGTGASAATMDAVWQHWLQTLPDMSIRKHAIHRKGRKGYNKDAIRAFAASMFHGSHNLARLKYGLRMEDNIQDAKAQAARQPNPERATFVVREMEQRHKFTMAPTNNPIVSAGTSLAFVWYLGMSPAAAMVNLTQTTVLGIPIMATRFQKAGVTGTTKALGKAARDWADGKTWVEKSKNLTADEKAAIREGYERGTIDRTQAHDLPSVADSGIQYNPGREKAMRVIGYLFHHAERLNREVTYLASYRLLREDGIDHEAAIVEADAMVKKVHFDYQNTSRPRVMQGDFAKIFLTFRNFSVNMLYRLFRDTHQAFKGDTPEARREARGQLVGITLSMMAHAGIRGTWGFGLLMMLLSVFPGDDEPEEWLQDVLLMEGDDPGTAAWNWIMGMALNGVPGHVTGVSLSERIGMPNLWFRGPREGTEGADVWAHYLAEFVGPVFGLGARWASGLSMMGDAWGEGNGDNWLRGVEKMVPNAAASMIVKPARFGLYGANTYYGDPLMDVGPLDMLRTGLGFTPAELAERYEINARLKSKERAIMGQRADIHRAIGKAVTGGEGIPERVLADMRAFNTKYPEYPITPDSIRQSMGSRARAKARNEFGVSLNPKLNDRIRGDMPPSMYN